MTSELEISACALPSWPNGARVAVSLTFDVDVEVELLARQGPGASLGPISEALFGVVRGIPRLLTLLADHDVRATFFVPGDVALRHPNAVRSLVEAGHEVAHHGHAHVAPTRLESAGQRDEIERGVNALTACVGASPRGYRAPGWEPTWETLRLLIELGFEYDSSLMHDDRPYRLRGEDGAQLLELPVHWSLDDWALFGWEPGYQGTLSGVAALAGIWQTELLAAVREERHVTYTMHPEVIGRGHRIEAVDAFLTVVKDHGAWFGTHAEVAALYSEHEGGSR